MKYLAAIQARFGSNRLRGKILMDLGGKPVLERVIERVEQSENVDNAIVITSIEPADTATVHFVSGIGRQVFAGSENDVLDRYYQAAKLFEPEYVIRVTGDCPLYDPRLLDYAIENMDKDSDYMGAVSETIADGTDIEIFKFAALKDAWQNARLKSEREHVTLYVKNHPEKFKIQDLISPYGNLNRERWSLDEPQDYELIKKIYEHFGDGKFYTRDIVKYLDANPDLRKINGSFGRNEGLEKSLREDGIAEVKN